MNLNWLIKMAWRDSRRNRSRLLLFISSIVLGIAALVAINSFGENLQKDINGEAKSLIGADLVIEGTHPAADSTQQLFDSLGGEQANASYFASMVLFPQNGGTRLAQVRALEGPFPFYGKITTQPENAYLSFQEEQKALVDKTLMLQYDVSVGDSIKVGNHTFQISGEVSSSPGQAGISSSIAPMVYIPQSQLEATGLVITGSRVEYKYYFKFEESQNKKINELTAGIENHIESVRYRYETVEGRKENIGESFENLTTFLNLVGFIALLLGCIGVASAVHIYVKDKLSTVAILRCVGTTGRQAFQIYLIQILVMGVIGSIVGALLGSLLQVLLPTVLEDFLPIQNVSREVSWRAIIGGVTTGLGIALLFALLPLLAIRKTSPLRTLRASYEESNTGIDYWKWVVYVLILLFIAGFTYIQTREGMETFFFPLGILVSFLLLAGVARLLMWFVRKFFPVRWSYVWRQGVANLYRPNNQTLILVVAIGLGTALISTLFFMQNLLLDQVEMTGSGDQPNMILFDIQSSQKEGVAQLAVENDLPLIQQVPIVTIRIDNVNGVTKMQNEMDTTENRMRGWALNREYRVTYRDTLIETETIVDGTWHGEKEKDGITYISIADNVARGLNAEIGTKITFNVQGALIETEVSSIREVNFNRVQTNFLCVFQTGVLEKAPQFHVVITKVDNPEKSATFQRKLVEAFPNVSVVDLGQILKSVDEVLGKVSFVIRFMALFSILTGLLVLISSVVLSKYQRIKESVLLRTLGAKSRQILAINAIEYFLLGALATLTGIGLSFIGSWALAKFSFKIPFTPDWWPPFLVFLIIVSLTMIIGLFNSREVLRKTPLEVLRAEI